MNRSLKSLLVVPMLLAFVLAITLTASHALYAQQSQDIHCLWNGGQSYPECGNAPAAESALAEATPVAESAPESAPVAESTLVLDSPRSMKPYIADDLHCRWNGGQRYPECD